MHTMYKMHTLYRLCSTQCVLYHSVHILFRCNELAKKPKSKPELEDELKKARSEARNARAKLKAFREGFEEGVKIAKEASRS